MTDDFEMGDAVFPDESEGMFWSQCRTAWCLFLAYDEEGWDCISVTAESILRGICMFLRPRA